MPEQLDLPFDVERIPDGIRELAKNHNRQLRALDDRAQEAVSRRLEKAVERIEERVDQIPDESFRRHQDRIIKFLSSLTRTTLTAELEVVTAQSIRSAFRIAPAQLEEEIKQWGKEYSHETRPLNLRAIAELDDEIIIQRIPRSHKRYGPLIANAIQDELATSLAERATTDRVVASIQRIAATTRWKADEIVRTEMQEAYNASYHESLTTANEMWEEDVMKKSALATFDSRTAQDSFPVHGQVRELDEDFIDGDGREYLHPPGRPNDREREIPWMKQEGAEIMSREKGIEKAQTAREAMVGSRQRIRERTRERIEEFSDAGEGEELVKTQAIRAVADTVTDEKFLTIAGTGILVAAGAVVFARTGAAKALGTKITQILKNVDTDALTRATKDAILSLLRQTLQIESRRVVNGLLSSGMRRDTAAELFRPLADAERSKEVVKVLRSGDTTTEVLQ